MTTIDSRTSTGLQRILAVLRRRAWVVLLCLVVAAAAAFALSKVQTKEYTATTSVVFNNQSAAQQAAGITSTATNDPVGQRATNLLILQLADVVVSRQAAATLGSGLTAKQVQSAVVAAQAGQTNVVSISATWTSPDLAAGIANAYANTFIQRQRQTDEGTVQEAVSLVQQQFDALTKIQKETPQGQSLLDRLESLKVDKSLQNNIQVAQAATAPTSPSSPRLTRNVVLGAVVGLLLGIALAFQLDGLDQRMRDPREVEAAFGVPMLGLIPHGDERPAKSARGGWNPDLEPFRMLRAHLRYFNVDRDLRTLMVVSPFPAEGKTTVAYGLAAAAASMGTKTLLIEADLRNPVIERALGLEPGIGLTGALITADGLENAVQSVVAGGQADGNAPGRRLDVIPAGAVPPNPAEMLESNAMKYVLAWARQRYDLVVVDSAPLSVVPDSIPLMNHIDGVIVVSRLGHSRRDAAERLREQLGNLSAPVIGLVVDDMRSRSGGYGYGYGYGKYGEVPSPAHEEPTPDPVNIPE